jgi:hypothetical protein
MRVMAKRRSSTLKAHKEMEHAKAALRSAERRGASKAGEAALYDKFRAKEAAYLRSIPADSVQVPLADISVYDPRPTRRRLRKNGRSRRRLQRNPSTQTLLILSGVVVAGVLAYYFWPKAA